MIDQTHLRNLGHADATKSYLVEHPKRYSVIMDMFLTKDQKQQAVQAKQRRQLRLIESTTNSNTPSTPDKVNGSVTKRKVESSDKDSVKPDTGIILTKDQGLPSSESTKDQGYNPMENRMTATTTHYGNEDEMKSEDFSNITIIVEAAEDTEKHPAASTTASGVGRTFCAPIIDNDVELQRVVFRSPKRKTEFPVESNKRQKTESEPVLSLEADLDNSLFGSQSSALSSKSSSSAATSASSQQIHQLHSRMGKIEENLMVNNKAILSLQKVSSQILETLKDIQTAIECQNRSFRPMPLHSSENMYKPSRPSEEDYKERRNYQRSDPRMKSRYASHHYNSHYVLI
jgi:hypothetical protein